MSSFLRHHGFLSSAWMRLARGSSSLSSALHKRGVRVISSWLAGRVRCYGRARDPYGSISLSRRCVLVCQDDPCCNVICDIWGVQAIKVCLITKQHDEGSVNDLGFRRREPMRDAQRSARMLFRDRCEKHNSPRDEGGTTAFFPADRLPPL